MNAFKNPTSTPQFSKNINQVPKQKAVDFALSSNRNNPKNMLTKYQKKEYPDDETNIFEGEEDNDNFERDSEEIKNEESNREFETLVPINIRNKTKLAHNVHVSVRIMPNFNSFEKSKIWRVKNDCELEYIQENLVYNFDKVFNDKMTTEKIFDSYYKSMIDRALLGYNMTIFAYGQTATGKTHTLHGKKISSQNALKSTQNDFDLKKQQLGLIQLSIIQIFENIQNIEKNQNLLEQSALILQANQEVRMNFQRPNQLSKIVTKKTIKIWISYMEIYNESVNDLLDINKNNLQVREDKNKEIHIDGLSKFEVHSIEEILQYLDVGNSNKKQADNKINDKSSRSHTVFRVELKIIEENIQTRRKVINSSEINLVDLAGSEIVGKRNLNELRMREGNNINKSLLALSNVIMKLSQKQSKHINFRDSKLTRILQKSLSGNSQTAIICTINQLKQNVLESQTTLNFGLKAKQIKHDVQLNQIVQEYPEEITYKILEMQRTIESLKEKIDEKDLLLKKIHEEQSSQNYNIPFLTSEIEILESKILEKEQEICELNFENQKELQECRKDILQMRIQCIEIEGLKDDNKLMKSDIQRISENLRVSENNNKVYQEQIQQLQEVVQNQKDRISRLQEINNETNHENQKNQMALINNQINNLEIENPNQISFNQQNEKRAITQEEAKMWQQIEQLYQELQEQVGKFNQTEQQLQTSHQQLENEKLANQKKDIMIKTLEDVLAQTRTKLNIAENEIQKKQVIQQKLQQRLEILERQNKSIYKELDRSISQINQSQQLNNSFMSCKQFDNSVHNLQIIENNFNTEKKSYRENPLVNEIYENKEVELMKLHDELEQLKSKYQLLQEENEDLNNQISILVKKNIEIDEEKEQENQKNIEEFDELLERYREVFEVYEYLLEENLILKNQKKRSMNQFIEGQQQSLQFFTAHNQTISVTQSKEQQNQRNNIYGDQECSQISFMDKSKRFKGNQDNDKENQMFFQQSIQFSSPRRCVQNIQYDKSTNPFKFSHGVNQSQGKQAFQFEFLKQEDTIHNNRVGKFTKNLNEQKKKSSCVFLLSHQYRNSEQIIKNLEKKL